MRSFDLDTLEIFCAVVHEGGVLRAAEKLHRVQSNVTTRIKQMEDRMGVALFRRKGRSLVLTEAGQTFLPHAERLLRLADDAEHTMRNSWVHGAIHLGSMESTIGSRLPPLLTRFHAAHPNISVAVETGTTDALLRGVREHRIDAAFVGEPLDLSGLESRAVFDETLVVITAKGHAPVRTARDLDSATMLVFAKGCAYRRVLEGWFADQGIQAEAVVELASYQAIIACAAAGAGCGIVPASVLETTLAAQQVERHDIPMPFAVNTTHLVWQAENQQKLRPLFDLLGQVPENRSDR